MLMTVFRKLPQRVLWKYEDEGDMPELPSNVKLGKWLPQQDILGINRQIMLFVLGLGCIQYYVLNISNDIRHQTLVYENKDGNIFS